MSRIAPIDVASATGEAAAQLDAARKLFGTIPNLAATAAHSPPIPMPVKKRKTANSCQLLAMPQRPVNEA